MLFGKRYDPKYRILPIILWSIFFDALVVISVGLFVVSDWYKKTYDLEFKELLYTLASPLKGTGEGTLELIRGIVVPPMVITAIVFAFLAVIFAFRKPIFRHFRRIGALLCVICLIVSVVFSMNALRIPGYLKAWGQQTTIYEDYYVDPDSVVISAGEEGTKSLLYIYLESMETTYASKEDGGCQPENNYIPGLTQLASKEISFTDDPNGKLGGFHSISGSTWTMGALLATTSGIPFSFPLGANANEISEREYFASGLTTLGDILAEKGYYQEFLCGSDSVFGGRKAYFQQHGNYEIFDFYTARQKGYIPEDYYVWWGFEDAILYQIAQNELLRLSEMEQPFNLTMLTVDPHHVDGYVCSQCGTEYEGRLENVLQCADNQLTSFIEWCKQQSFYEDTTIIISGDHPRMDVTLVGDAPLMDRTIYNCFLNSAVSPQQSTSGRNFTSLDMFPTILAAMGFTVEGDRLGLGVNLFSTLPTLSESLGYGYLDQEVNKFSEYYILNFS